MYVKYRCPEWPSLLTCNNNFYPFRCHQHWHFFSFCSWPQLTWKFFSLFVLPVLFRLYGWHSAQNRIILVAIYKNIKSFKTSGGPPVTSAPYIFHYMPWLGLLLSSFMECDHRCYMSHIPVYAKFTFLYKPPQLCSEANIYHLNTHNASGILPGRTSPVACSICFTSHKTQIIRNVSTHWWIWFTEICLLIPLLSCGMWRRVTL